jgi:hypothetical protein
MLLLHALLARGCGRRGVTTSYKMYARVPSVGANYYSVLVFNTTCVLALTEDTTYINIMALCQQIIVLLI